MNIPRILIVEDEAIVAADIKMRLRRLGYEAAEICASGEKALEVAAQENPSLVLMDIHLQGEMDGIETARKIREQLQLPVIFITAYAEDSTLARAKLAEPHGYILKPFEDRELKSTIEISLYRHQAELEIRRLNRLYSVLSQVNQVIVRSQSREQLFAEICRIIVEVGKFKLAWIGWLDPQSQSVKPLAHFGDETGYVNKIQVVADDRPEGQGPTGTCIRSGRHSIRNRFLDESPTLPWLSMARAQGFRAVAGFPLRRGGRIIGALTVHAVEEDYFQDREVELLNDMAMDVSFALDHLEAEAQRQQAERQLKLHEEQLDALNMRLQSLREEERTRIAREIHDELGQMLTALKLDLRWVEQEVENLEPARPNNFLLDKAVSATSLVDAMSKTVQRIASELRPGILDKLGLPLALQHEASAFHQRTGIKCQLQLPESEPDLPPEIVTALYRICQEALTNIARHANATKVEVTFQRQSAAILLTVKDNGAGIGTNELLKPSSLGLLGMQERARQFGGRLTFETPASGGTLISVSIPLHTP